MSFYEDTHSLSFRMPSLWYASDILRNVQVLQIPEQFRQGNSKGSASRSRATRVPSLHITCILCCTIVVVVCVYFMIVDFGFQSSYNHLYSDSEIRSYLTPLRNAHYNQSNFELKFSTQRYKENGLLTQYESFPEYELNQSHIYRTFIRHKQGKGIVYSVGTELGLIQTFVSISIIRSQTISTPNESDSRVGLEVFVENIKLFKGCTQLFHDTDIVCRQLDAQMIAFVDANFYKKDDGTFPNRRLWSAKYIAMITSRFEHVLFLDCDNILIRDPNELFLSTYYRNKYQVVFWPDLTYGPNNWCDFRFYVEAENKIWDVYGLSQRYDANDIRYVYSMESGQILMNTKLYHNELLFALSNNDGNVTRTAIYGDKDFWRITFLLFNTSFAMVPYLPVNMGSISTMFRGKTHMGQFWFDHKLVFIHGNKRLNCYPFIQLVLDKPFENIRNQYRCRDRYAQDIEWIPTKLARDISSFVSGYRLSLLSDSHYYIDDESIRVQLHQFQESWRTHYLSACLRLMTDESEEGLCQCMDPFPVFPLWLWAFMVVIVAVSLVIIYLHCDCCRTVVPRTGEGDQFETNIVVSKWKTKSEQALIVSKWHTEYIRRWRTKTERILFRNEKLK